ncbi:unnamed protein product [Didymodactylos carnosus]|uniref:Uncharacterized protein n=1 Tax=Didymodactylos carnosus TaxID=1234261 RepID=A0A8S2FLW6_9BILA|nr:unnamed protein product [Didymodactylos carnosus]CAF4296117.1 unnamed protein product [Didymodactylos carnosus]
MGNRGARNTGYAPYGDPYLDQYGAGYYPGGAAPGLGGYGGGYDPYGGYGGMSPYGYITTPGAIIEEPWQTTQWNEYYVPTPARPVAGGRRSRPVIYVAVPMPAANPCAGFGGGFGGGLGGFGGGLGGFGGGLGGFGGGLGGMSGFGGGLPGGFRLVQI